MGSYRFSARTIYLASSPPGLWVLTAGDAGTEQKISASGFPASTPAISDWATLGGLHLLDQRLAGSPAGVRNRYPWINIRTSADANDIAIG